MSQNELLATEIRNRIGGTESFPNRKQVSSHAQVLMGAGFLSPVSVRPRKKILPPAPADFTKLLHLNRSIRAAALNFLFSDRGFVLGFLSCKPLPLLYQSINPSFLTRIRLIAFSQTEYPIQSEHSSRLKGDRVDWGALVGSVETDLPSLEIIELSIWPWRSRVFCTGKYDPLGSKCQMLWGKSTLRLLAKMSELHVPVLVKLLLQEKQQLNPSVSSALHSWDGATAFPRRSTSPTDEIITGPSNVRCSELLSDVYYTCLEITSNNDPEYYPAEYNRLMERGCDFLPPRHPLLVCHWRKPQKVNQEVWRDIESKKRKKDERDATERLQKISLKSE
ncbi:MAG: hypothetical protein Q9167_004527 [Letrouitia subvulpina]